MNWRTPCWQFLLLSLTCHGQPGNIYVRNYPPESYTPFIYGSSPQNKDVIQDHRGIIYVANSDAIMEFDGNSWHGLINPDEITDCAGFAIDSSGVIFMGGKNNFGFLLPDASGNVAFNSLKSLWDDSTSEWWIKSIHTVGNNICFVSENFLLVYDHKKIRHISAPDKLVRSWIMSDSLYLIADNGVLYTLNGGSFKRISDWNERAFKSAVQTLMLPDTKGLPQWLVFTNDAGIFQWEGKKIRTLNAALSIELSKVRINKALELKNQSIVLGTVTEGIIIIDRSGKILKRIWRRSGMNDNQVNSLYIDSKNGLWAALSKGISRIEYPSAFTFLDYSNELDGVVLSIHRQGNHLYAGTTTGLYVANTTDEFMVFEKLLAGSNVWKFLETSKGIWIATGFGVFLQTNGAIKKMFEIQGYCLQKIPSDSNIILVGTDDGIAAIDTRISTAPKLLGYLSGVTTQVGFIESDKEGILWAGGASGYRIDFKSKFSLQPEVTFINAARGWDDSLKVLEVSKVNDSIFFGTWKGLYRYDGVKGKLVISNRFSDIFNLHPRETTCITQTAAGDVWIHSEEITGIVHDSSEITVWDTLPLLRLPRTGVWSMSPDTSGSMWLGTTDGIFFYNPSTTNSGGAGNFNVFIRNIKISSDSLIFNGNFSDQSGHLSLEQSERFQLTLPFTKNDISFAYSAASYFASEALQYSYYLQGRDESWSSWSAQTQRQYTGLHEGNYVFYVRAKNIYNIESTVATFKFDILPPWYRTWWAYLIYVVAFVLFIRLIIQINQWRLINDKKSLAKKVDERTKEISRQKELVETEKEKVENKTHELEHTLDALRQTQSQLIQSEKMASIGQLTAGIAHEINNPINFVASNINPLKRNLADVLNVFERYSTLRTSADAKSALEQIDEYKKEIGIDYTITETKKLLESIEEGSKRTAEIVKGLRSFSRLDEDELKKTNINDAIETTLLLLQNKLQQQHIEVIRSFGNIPLIDSYSGQLKQVFMNLLTNAIEAIGSNGKVIITTFIESGHVKICIRDTGAGMSQGVKQKIFDPFFTTKPVGKGTGLGLSISYGIIEKHHGRIDVSSEVGKGSEFIVTLPVSAWQVTDHS